MQQNQEMASVWLNWWKIFIAGQEIEGKFFGRTHIAVISMRVRLAA